MSLTAAELARHIRNEPGALIRAPVLDWVRIMMRGPVGGRPYEVFDPPPRAGRFAHPDVVKELRLAHRARRAPVVPVCYRQLYAATELRTALAEVFVHSATAKRRIARAAIEDRDLVGLRLHPDFLVFDLTDPDLLLRLRIDSDSVMGRKHAPSYPLGLAIHDLPQKPHGILYRSRLRDTPNLMIFDRAWLSADVVSVVGRDPLARAIGLVADLEAIGVTVEGAGRAKAKPTPAT